MTNQNRQQKGVSISNAKSVTIGGDLVGGDKITYMSEQKVSNRVQIMNLWQEQIDANIEKTKLSPDEKADLKRQIDIIRSALVADETISPNRLEKLINTIAVMSPDIFDVVIATLSNPLAGLGLAIKKISDKAKIERKA